MANVPFYVDIDLKQNQLLNARIQNLSSDPVSPGVGQIWKRTDLGVLRYFDGTDVQTLATGGALADAVTRALVAGAENELMVSGGANRSAKTFSTGSETMIKISATGVVSAAVVGTDYLTASSTNTLTNKTFDAQGTGNSITNLAVSNFATGVVITSIGLTPSDTTVPTAKAVADYVAGELGTALTNVVTRDAEIVENRIMVSVGGGDTRKAKSLEVVGLIKLNATHQAELAIAGTDYVTAASTNTFTNKTFNAEGVGNSITNLQTTNFKTGVVVTTISAASTDTELPTANAVYDYVDLRVTSLGQFVGSHDATTGLPLTGSGPADAIVKGDYWRINVAGTITGLGVLEVGDVLVASIDDPIAAADFFVMQGNITDAVTSSSTSATDNSIPRFDGTSAKVIKTSQATIANDGTINIPTGAEYQINGQDILELVTPKRYSAIFNAGDWTGTSAPYTLTYAPATHGLGESAALMVRVMDDSGWQAIVDTRVSDTGTITLRSNTPFSGKVAIS